jgi:hypothetical protein
LVGKIAALSDSFIGYKDGAGCSTMECNGKDKPTLFAKQKMDQLWREIIKVYYPTSLPAKNQVAVNQRSSLARGNNNQVMSSFGVWYCLLWNKLMMTS